jgi:thiamine-phosphate pyrophosphorylase
MRPSPESLRGLYAITDAGLQPAGLLCERVSLAINGGAALIQYRDKSTDARLRLKQAQALAALCRQHDVRLIINDDVALAADCGADGVHLGRHDTDLTTARRLLGDAAILGVSCYNRLDLAQQAVDAGADYLAFGRFFPSQTKPDAIQTDVQLIRDAKQCWSLPVAVIGGITPYNAAPLLAAGADMLAVIHGVFGAGDVRQAAADYVALFGRGPENNAGLSNSRS